MRIELHIAADSAEELRKAVLSLAAAPGPKPEPEPVMPEPEPTLPPAEPAERPPAETRVEEPQPASEPEPAAAKPKRGRKKDNGDGAAVEETPLTLEDIYQVFNVYRDTFGEDAVMSDGPEILTSVFGAGLQRIRDIPQDDPAKMAEVITRVQHAIRSNEFNRTVVRGAA